MLIILELILIILIIILLILYIGFSVKFHLTKKEKEINGDIEIYFSKIRLIHKEIYPQKDDKREESEKKDRSIGNIKKYTPLIKKSKYTVKEIVNIILKSRDSINLKNLNIDLILGFKSSVDTAKTMGIFWIFATPLNLQDQCNIYGEADFSKEILDFKVDLNLKISLVKPVFRIINLILKKSTISLIIDFIKIKRSENGN